MKTRQSNIELLRLFSMFALLLLHFYVHALPNTTIYAEQVGFWKNFPLALSSLTSLQVNIFVLISGWFGIHTTPKKVIEFYLMCAFYSVLTYCMSLGMGSGRICGDNTTKYQLNLIYLLDTSGSIIQ